MEKYLEYLQSIGVPFGLLIGGISIVWLLLQALKNYQAIQILRIRPYRFQRIELHSKIIDSVDFIGDDNLKQLYLDSLKDEVFEKVGRFNFYGARKREAFLNIYPKLREHFSYRELFDMRSHLLLNRGNQIHVIPKHLYIVQNVIYFLVAGLILIAIFGTLSILKHGHPYGEGIWWIPMLIFAALILLRLETNKNVKKMRTVLAKINSC